MGSEILLSLCDYGQLAFVNMHLCTFSSLINRKKSWEVYRRSVKGEFVMSVWVKWAFRQHDFTFVTFNCGLMNILVFIAV